jgi:ubiquitin carboxyl-terminal hydrolase L3
MSRMTSSLISTASSNATPTQVTFHDVYTIDDPDFLAIIPRPVVALIFICSATAFSRARDAENEAMEEYKGSGNSEPVAWFRQTIRHACGTMALIHALSNARGREGYIQSGSLLSRLLAEAVPLQPKERADVLYNSVELERAHAEAAALGDTMSPEDLNEEFHHFIAFVNVDDGNLWELNGGMKGPVDRGYLGEEDALSEKALDLGVRTILNKAQREDRFSIVAMSIERQ